MTDLADLFRETVEAVDGACPCRTETRRACSPACDCRLVLHEFKRDPLTDNECVSPGHATIRERLGMIAERQHVYGCGCLPPRRTSYISVENFIEPAKVGKRCAALRVRLKEAINGR